MKVYIKYFLLILAFAFFVSCNDLLVEGDNVNTNFSDFESSWEIANRVYPFFQFKNINWNEIYLKYKPQAQNAKGDEIYNVLYNMFGELKDGHIELHTEGGFPVPTYLWQRDIERKSFSQNVVAHYIGKEFKLAGDNRISYETINNFGYIYISTFTEGAWIYDFDKVLDYMGNTDGLIIDVRNNGGGSSNTMDYIISKFTHTQIQFKFYNKDDSYRTFTIPPSSSFTYNKTVVILVNGASFSAAELFPELMRQLANVTIVGDTTGGGGGSTDIYKLPSGKRIKIPNSYFTRLDGTMVEWNGVIPDVTVQQTETDKNNNIDRQFETALNILTNKK